MKAGVLAISVLLLSSTFVVRAEEPPVRTAGTCNGHLWKSQSNIEHFAYALGVFDGLKSGSPTGHTDPAYYKCHHCRLNEIIHGITDFYDADDARLPIPIPTAIRIYVERDNGASDAAINLEIAGILRKLNQSDH